MNIRVIAKSDRAVVLAEDGSGECYVLTQMDGTDIELGDSLELGNLMMDIQNVTQGVMVRIFWTIGTWLASQRLSSWRK